MNLNLKNFVALAVATFSFAAPAAFAVDACPTSITASCSMVDEDGMPSCVDGIASSSLPVGDFQAQCESEGGVFSISACSTQNLAGSCLMNAEAGATSDATVILRLYAPVPAEYIPMICSQSHGTFCQ